MKQLKKMKRNLVVYAIIVSFVGILLISTQPAIAASTTPTYVLLVHGYSPTGSASPNTWTDGPNIYQKLVSKGYIVGTVEYYGSFSITYSNGVTFTDNSFSGSQYTSIESIANELAKGIDSLSQNQVINLNIVVHSMGGLITLQMLEHHTFSNVHLQQVISIASPFNGSPFAELSDILGWAIGYQATEMESGSTFLNQLKNNFGSVSTNFPSLIRTNYAGNYDPWWSFIFGYSSNDGVVSVSSAKYLGYSHLYLFNDVHISGMPTWGTAELSDSSITNEIVNNLAGAF